VDWSTIVAFDEILLIAVVDCQFLLTVRKIVRVTERTRQNQFHPQPLGRMAESFKITAMIIYEGIRKGIVSMMV